MPKGDYLGEFEQIALLALLRLGANAYGVTIRAKIDERTGRSVSLGAVYATLNRLERKGFVTSWMGDPTPERGGRAKKFFKITAPGQQALQRSLDAVGKMREGVLPAPGMALGMA